MDRVERSDVGVRRPNVDPPLRRSSQHHSRARTPHVVSSRRARPRWSGANERARSIDCTVTRPHSHHCTTTPLHPPRMDYQNRAGNKGAGVAGSSEANVDRRERLRKLAMETIDINKDPYILRNHLGSLECRLCLTIHTNEGSYLAHTQGKKHQTNLARRAAKEARDQAFQQQTQMGLLTGPNSIDSVPKKHFLKIGRPGYKITKIREPYIAPTADEVDEGGVPTGGRLGLLFQIQLPEIKPGIKPLHRFMSSFEQRLEPQTRLWQYLVVAAEPYETIAFKLQSREVDRSENVIYSAIPGTKPRQEPGTWSHWDPDVKTFSELQGRSWACSQQLTIRSNTHANSHPSPLSLISHTATCNCNISHPHARTHAHIVIPFPHVK